MKALFKEDDLSGQDDISVGQLLKKHREAMGIPLDIVAHNLCIRFTNLEKLEADHETLVSDVYTLGFLRVYAKFLNLNANALIQKFKKQVVPAAPSRLVFLAPTPERGIAGTNILLGSVGLFIIVACLAGYHWWRAHQEILPPKEAILPPKERSLPQSTSSVPISTVPVRERGSLLSQPPLPLEHAFLPKERFFLPLATEESIHVAETLPAVLHAIEKTWIDVRDSNGKVIVRRLLHAGQSYALNHPKNLILKVGNAKGIQITSGNKTLTFPNVEGVKSGISLNSSQWK